jgi:hypothetical protein
MNAEAVSTESAIEAFVVRLSNSHGTGVVGQGSNLSRGQKA